MTDILCFSTTDWDEIWGSRQQIMTCLANSGQRVLFVERQVGPEHLLRDRSLRARKRAAWKKPALHQVDSNLYLWQPPMLLPGRYYSPILNRLGQHRLVISLRPILDHLKFSQPLLWLYPPHSSPLIGNFSEKLVIYHCIDRFVGGQAGLKRTVMLAEETDLLQKADLVFTHAEGLRQLYQPYTRRPITVVPSAADVDRFQTVTDIHPEIANIEHPRLGVVGTLDARIDIQLLTNLALSNPLWQLILIGPERPGRIKLSLLLRLPNVHHLGARLFGDLPSILNGMDALLIPYVRDELTEYISPIKLYEYLAVGKPIVSVDLPEVRPMKHLIYIAHKSGDFAQTIQHALVDDTLQKQTTRRQEAWNHTWEKRAQLMWSIIEENLSQ